MLSRTEDIYTDLAQGNLGLALAGYEDYLNNNYSYMSNSGMEDS